MDYMHNWLNSDLYKYNLIWIIINTNDEDYYHFNIFEINSYYNSNEEYINKWNRLWFWFISINYF